MDEVYRKSLDCVHCGLCLSSCPTYLETGRESSSPRGRIYLMRAVADGRASLDGLLSEEAFLCLGCRACETACPSGVEYGAMLNLTRAAIQSAGLRDQRGAKLERLLLREVVPRPRRLHALMTATSWLQRTRLDRLGAAVLSRLSGLGTTGGFLTDALGLLPRIPPARERQPLPSLTTAAGPRRGRVALFTGCVMSELFGSVHRASVRVLVANGYDVVVPEEQGCCGALQAHGGDLEFARDLARRNVRVFEQTEIDAIVVNSAGCGAAMRETAADDWLGPQGREFAGRVRDIAEFLDEVGLREPAHTLAGRVCYDDPCHLVHGQRVSDAPRRILTQIPGLELVSHADPGACCGAAGVYNLTHREMSEAVLDRKLTALAAADPEFIATGNPGCLMQLRAGVAARGLSAQVLHPVELLDRAYTPAGGAIHQS